MAPKKHGKATPKAAVKKAAAKKAMAKKVAAKSSPKRPNKPAVTAVKLEPGAAQESEEASGSSLGLDRGLVSFADKPQVPGWCEEDLPPAEAGRPGNLGEVHDWRLGDEARDPEAAASHRPQGLLLGAQLDYEHGVHRGQL